MGTFVRDDTFVDKLAEPVFDWGTPIYQGTGSEDTKDLVNEKFTWTITKADEMLDLLIGSDGNGGFLGKMDTAIKSHVDPVIEAIQLTIPDMSSDVAARPTFDLTSLDTDFPEFDKASPVFVDIPEVDMSGLSDATAPDAITASIDWIATVHNSPVFTVLVNKLIADIQGGTGLDSVVEQEIWDRGIYRLELEEDAKLIELEEFFSAKGFERPTGAENAAVEEFISKKITDRKDLTGKISIEQAELAQKNVQAAIAACNTLEAVLRNDTNKLNDQELDFAKSKAANLIQLYAESVKAYLAELEGDKSYVELQVENIKAKIANNQALAELFSSEGLVYSTVVEAKAKKNEALTDVFKAENVGYDSETRAISEQNKSGVAEWGLRLQNADMDLQAQVEEAKVSLGGYTSESSLTKEVATSMANLAMQATASFAGAVNMSAGLSHATGRHESESISHTESRSDGHNKSNTLGESRSYTLGESHSFDETKSIAEGSA